LLTKGIARLSQLDIDGDKDWQTKQITNLKAIAQAMAHGDIAFRGGAVLEKLTADAGKGYNFLRSRGPGLSPVWEDIESLIQYMTAAANRAIGFDLAIPIPAVSQVIEQASSPPGRTATPLLSAPEPSVGMATIVGSGGGVIAMPSLGIPVAGMVMSEVATGRGVSGAVADDGGVQTDETAQANSATPNDMTLLPTVPAVNDAYYFGHSALWDWLRLNIGTAGAGVWTIVWEYWNGAAWAGLPNLSDGTSHFGNAGMNDVTFTRPGDWVVTTVGGIIGLYWIRARVSSYTLIVFQPLGTQAWIWVKH
jgi:hypothetical protein